MNPIATSAFLDRLVTPQILWSMFLFTTSAVIIVSIILLYHWRTYALQTSSLRNARITYIAGTAVLAILQLTALLSL